MVLEKYFDFHKELLGFDKFEDIDEKAAKLIAGFIYGDLGYRCFIECFCFTFINFQVASLRAVPYLC